MGFFDKVFRRSHAKGELSTADYEEIRSLLQVTPSVDQDTDYAMEANTRAKRAANQGRHLEAIRGYTAVIVSTLEAFPPAAAQGYYNRGNSLDELGLYREAVEDFTQALAILDQTGFSDPELLSKIHNNRGISLENLDRRDEAISEYSAAIKDDPQWSSPYYNRGLAFESQGNLNKAGKDYEVAAKLGNHEASNKLRTLASGLHSTLTTA